MPALTHPQKITFGEMRDSGVRGVLVYCSDYRCCHSTAISADRWPNDVRLSDIEPRFTCQASGQRSVDVHPNFGWVEGRPAQDPREKPTGPARKHRASKAIKVRLLTRKSLDGRTRARKQFDAIARMGSPPISVARIVYRLSSAILPKRSPAPQFMSMISTLAFSRARRSTCSCTARRFHQWCA
jgi:hypothetical protein